MSQLYPGLLTYFSFQNGVFSWAYEFDQGVVGPFAIGENAESLIDTARKCECFYVYPAVSNEPRIKLSQGAIINVDSVIDKDGKMILSKTDYGSPVVYELLITHRRLSKARVHSSLFSGI